MSLASFDPAKLERFTHDFEELFYAADPAAMTAYYAEHAQLMADGMQPIQATRRSRSSGRPPLPAPRQPGPGAPSGCTSHTPRATWVMPCAR
jgi:hypothetical protein